MSPFRSLLVPGGRAARRLVIGGLMILFPAAGDAQPDVRPELAAAGLEPALARQVQRLNIEVGGASVRLKEGWVVPTTEVAGQVREFVFLGVARFEMEPPDEVEANQLELFTDKRTVAEEVTQAVLVAGSDAIAAALLEAPVEALDAARTRQARDLLAAWRDSGERETLLVEQMLWVDALGDPAGNSYFAGWFRDEEEESFLFLYDPWEFEQVSLGQFVQLELTDREERKIQKSLQKEHRKGRLIGLDVAELGTWDSWISSSPRNTQGVSIRGGAGLDAEHYLMTIGVAAKTLELTGEARLVLRATTEGLRAVPLELGRDLVVESVRGADDAPLPFDQQNNRVIVALADSPNAGDSLTLVVTYRGRIFDKRDSARVLRTTAGWYPRMGDYSDRATYDVTFRWPKRLDLLGTGSRAEGGSDGDERWERRRLDLPASFFSFELGRFDVHTSQAGDTPITLALDPFTRSGVRKEVSNLLETAGDVLLYYEEIFGEYPYPDLTIVTLPRSYSQAPPGFITLDRYSAVNAADDDGTENQWVLAHEIAHQWWGHAVGWQSYRDQWISEAMANYAALLFVRNRGEGKRMGPTQGWRSALLRRTRDGRQIESLGPIVLGQRLFSSFSSSAYAPIVYRKGAVVIDMLARSFGEETFLEVLRSMVRAVKGRSISTEDFFDLIERITGAELDAFTDQFIYNTGLPEVYYDYSIEQNGTGEWVVRGEAIQNSPFRLEYRLVQRPNGGQLDVDSRQVVQIDVEGSTLVVPVQAVLYDPNKQSGAEDPLRTGNTVMQFHTVVRGRRTPFEFKTPHEPKQVWLDARGEVFGHFFSQRRHPKRVLYYRGLDLAVAERWGEATAKLREALAAEPFDGPSWGEEESQRARIRERFGIDARIHWRLMRMHLAQGHTTSAQAAFEAAGQSWREVEKTNRSRYSAVQKPSYATVLEARLDLQKRNPQRAYDVLKERQVGSREWYLTMALAARALGKQKEYEAAVKEAEERGADVSLLTDEEAPTGC